MLLLAFYRCGSDLGWNTDYVTIFITFLSTFNKILEQYLEVGYESFRSHFLHFTVHKNPTTQCHLHLTTKSIYNQTIPMQIK
jgi:hypothetical protein